MVPTDQTPKSLISSVGNSSVHTSASCTSQEVEKNQIVLDFKLFPIKRKFVEESDDEEILKTNIVPKNIWKARRHPRCFLIVACAYLHKLVKV